MAFFRMILNFDTHFKVFFLNALFQLAGIIVASVSSWVLHKSMQAVKNPTKTTAENLLYQVNTFFGGTTGLYDLDVIFRILIYCR